MFRANRQKIFDRVQVEYDYCEDCKFLVRIHEPEGLEYECQGDRFSCHQVDTEVSCLEEWMEDNQAAFELIEWVD